MDRRNLRVRHRHGSTDIHVRLRIRRRANKVDGARVNTLPTLMLAPTHISVTAA